MRLKSALHSSGASREASKLSVVAELGGDLEGLYGTNVLVASTFSLLSTVCSNLRSYE